MISNRSSVNAKKALRELSDVAEENGIANMTLGKNNAEMSAVRRII